MIPRHAVVSLVASVLSVCISHGTARSAELKIFTSRAIATVLAKIGPEFEKNSGHKLNVITGLSSEFVGRINAAETFDVIAAPPAVLDGLIKSGKVAGDSKTNLVRSANGVEVLAGAPKPDISSVDAFKRALLNANRSPIFLCQVYRKSSSGLDLRMRLHRRRRFQKPTSVPSSWPRAKSNWALWSSRRF